MPRSTQQDRESVEQFDARPQAAGLVTPLIQAVMEDVFFFGGGTMEPQCSVNALTAMAGE